MQECCIFLNAFSSPSSLTPPGPKRGVEDAAPYTQNQKVVITARLSGEIKPRPTGPMIKGRRGKAPLEGSSRAAGEGWLGCNACPEDHPSVTYGDSSPLRGATLNIHRVALAPEGSICRTAEKR